jgi:hypothetical protein
LNGGKEDVKNKSKYWEFLNTSRNIQKKKGRNRLMMIAIIETIMFLRIK